METALDFSKLDALPCLKPRPERTTVMAVLNVTPDSFSDGGILTSEQAILSASESALELGADILDIGGESTRPGSHCVNVEDEIYRVVPAITAIVKWFPNSVVSIDTRKSQVAQAAMDAGATLVNDVSGLQFDAAMADTVGRYKAGLFIMHSQGTPDTMQHNPTYIDVAAEVLSFLATQKNRALQAGVPGHRILLDPGFGFGKTLEHNLQLLRELAQFSQLESPIAVGTSRKSFLTLGQASAIPPTDREALTSASLAAAIQAGAALVRIHDVKTQAPVIRWLDALYR